MSQPVFNREAIRPGDIISRYTGGPIAWGICIATNQWKINHDALIIPNRYGELCVGDALMSLGCQLTPLTEWENNCINKGDRVLIGRPLLATEENGLAAANWWLENVNGRKYDRVALAQILRKRIFGTWWKTPVGEETHFYCSEGCRDSYTKATTLRPWGNAINVTPGTTIESYWAGRIVEILEAFTVYGERWKVEL